MMEMIKAFFAKITAFFLSIITAITALFGVADVPEAPKEDTNSATQREYCFDDDRLLIGAYNFYQNNETEKLVLYANEAGFDFIISSAYEEYLDLCDENGIGVIVRDYNEFAPYIYRENPDSTFAKWSQLTEENYNYSHPCVWGDYILDEPKASLFPAIGVAAESYYANTTGKLPYVNLLPMHAKAEMLGNVTPAGESGTGESPSAYVDRYKTHIAEYIENVDTDYLCTDIYPLFNRPGDGAIVKKTYDSWLGNLDVLATVCRETGRNLWVITQAAGKDTNDAARYCDNPEDIRWQMYVTLAFGAKAIIHACYYGGWWDAESHMIDSDFNRTDTYYAVKQVNSELSAFADIYGNYISCGVFIANGAKAAGNIVNHITLDEGFNKPVETTDDAVLVGCFDAQDGSGTAYSIVNMYEPQLNKEAEITLRFPNTASLTVYRKGVAENIEGDTLTLTLESREGVFVTAEK